MCCTFDLPHPSHRNVPRTALNTGRAATAAACRAPASASRAAPPSSTTAPAAPPVTTTPATDPSPGSTGCTPRAANASSTNNRAIVLRARRSSPANRRSPSSTDGVNRICTHPCNTPTKLSHLITL